MIDHAQVFQRLRPRLQGLAYRMLGSVGDAEDAVQEAFLRWHGADVSEIRSPEAWLVTVVTRLCLDRLRAAAAEREAYIGPWLPEPLVGGRADAPDRRVARASALSMVFLIVLERLAPEERAAFLLRDVFDCGYPDIARALGKSEAACRQTVHRARARVRRDKPRFEVSEAAHQRLLRRYLDALNTRDEAKLVALFAEDATLVTDGGGKVVAALNVIRGADKITRGTLGVMRKISGRIAHEVVPINGQLGIATYVDGRPFSATAIEADGRRILAVFRVLTPDKLGGLIGLAPAQGERPSLAS